MTTSGYGIVIGGKLVSWKNKKHNVVSRSSAKAKFWAMALATCILIWLMQLLEELQFGENMQMNLVCANQTALDIAYNPIFH